MKFSGQSFTSEQVEEVTQKWRDRRNRLIAEFAELCNKILSQGDDIVLFPPKPLKVLPETTYSCVKRGYCYHREYMTSDTSMSKYRLIPTMQDPVNCSVICVCLAIDVQSPFFPAKSTLGFRRPQQMMQVFSLRLSGCNSKSYPISLYGIFAIRDDLEPLRNYIFDCSRDDPIMIHQVRFIC